MYKRRRIIQPKIPSSVQEFDLLLQESQYADCHLQTVVDVDQIAVIFGSRHIIDKLKNVSDIQFHGTLQLSQDSSINFLQSLLTLKAILYLGYIF